LTKKPRATGATGGTDGLAAASDISAIVAGTHGDPFAVLGIQKAGKGFVARCFIPHAESVTAHTLDGKAAGTLSRRG
jgi:1,4-alpha-glucan branching enzyme